jgi:hypothetical protein
MARQTRTRVSPAKRQATWALKRARIDFDEALAHFKNMPTQNGAAAKLGKAAETVASAHTALQAVS